MERSSAVGEESAAADADLLAGLQGRGRGSVWQLVLAVGFLALGAGQCAVGTWWLGVGYLVLGLVQAQVWWTNPRPRVRAITPDALLVRRGLRDQEIPRTDVVDAHPKYTRSYGVEVSVRGGERLRFENTAPRFSVAEAQATALRRWAGMDR